MSRGRAAEGSATGRVPWQLLVPALLGLLLLVLPLAGLLARAPWSTLPHFHKYHIIPMGLVFYYPLDG